MVKLIIYYMLYVSIVVMLYCLCLQAYGDEPLESVLMHVEDGDVVEMDRWMLSVWPLPEMKVFWCVVVLC